MVTERATRRIDVVIPQAFAGRTPLGFTFREDGTLIVSEATGGVANASTTPGYRIDRQGILSTITEALPTDQTAACWIEMPCDGRRVDTTNAVSVSLTGCAAGVIVR